MSFKLDKPHAAALVPALVRIAGWLRWPWSEDLLALAFAARCVVKPAAFARAWRWAGQGRGAFNRRLAVTATVVANQGRFLAVRYLAGMREPDVLRRHSRIEGREHLTRADSSRGVMLLGFHAGPPMAWVVLRLHGVPLAFAGGPVGVRPGSPAWSAVLRDHQIAWTEDAAPAKRALAMASMRRRLRQGETMFVTGDGAGAVAFTIPCHGGTTPLRAGWWALRRETDCTVIPVVAFRDGRTEVVQLLPPLPAPCEDAEADVARCRPIVAAILNDLTARHPAQSPTYAMSPEYWQPCATEIVPGVNLRRT